MDVSCSQGAVNINSASSSGSPSAPGGGDVNINCAQAHSATAAWVPAAQVPNSGAKEPPPWYPGPSAASPVKPGDYEQVAPDTDSPKTSDQ